MAPPSWLESDRQPAGDSDANAPLMVLGGGWEGAMNATTVEKIPTTCAIAGGGPAGMMLGFLLARAGVKVVLLEKHQDFLRDFRGDTIHPSTLELMHELGFLDEFLKLPHKKVQHMRAVVGGVSVQLADFAHLPGHARFIAFMPQWDFLTFLATQGARYPGFDLRMQAEVTELIKHEGRCVGLRARTPHGELEITAALVVGADGRHSTVRERAGLVVDDLGAPIDVLWMRLSRQPGDPEEPLARMGAGRIFGMIDRGDYWQCAFVIPKGGFEEVKQRGLDALRAEIVALAPRMRERVTELRSWDDVKLLTVKVDRLRQWYQPGLLCIGDAAHAMSPVGGVGINLAIQDAVAAANRLARPLLAGEIGTDALADVQRRRMFPTRATQGVQVLIQKKVLSAVLGARKLSGPPLPMRLVNRWPRLQRIPARIVGLGFRPEHIATPDVGAAAAT
jgi:2-polyprenyl-6-methoxyphenol hydroxylase-like FAD-dependent oxidoreductase